MNEIPDFSKIIEALAKRMDDSILGLTYNSNGHHDVHCIALTKIFQVLKKLEECQKTELLWLKSQEFVTTKDLKHTEVKIMSKISEFAVRQNAFNDRMDVAVTDLQSDVTYLTDTIATLQQTSGSISTEDQALLDQIEVRAGGIADKLDALDALTPPQVPVSGSV